MADKLVDYSLRSAARFLENNVSGLDDAYIITPDFNWDKKRSNLNPNKQVDRELPYAAVLLNSDLSSPFSVGNILYQQEVDCSVYIAAKSYTSMVNYTGDMKQALKGAVNPETSSVGIPLYNFAVASGASFALAGTLQVELGSTQYFSPDEVDSKSNIYYRSVTQVGLSAFKDATATLLENKGRINLTDT